MEIPVIECGITVGISFEGLFDALVDEGFRPKRQDDGYISFSRNNNNYIASCSE